MTVDVIRPAGNGESVADRAKHHWALGVVLAVQAILTLSWLWRFSPSNDEALYLRVGHEEIAAWFSHGHIPGRIPSTYFSGAPFGSPVLNATASNLGGLTAARSVSMILMLIVTVLVYFTALELSGRRQAAALSAGFAGLTGVAGFLGSSATFEPLALALLMTSVWLTVRAKGDWKIYLQAGVLLFFSNLAKYGTVAWIPVVGVIAALTCGGTWWHGTLPVSWKTRVFNGLFV